MKAFAVLLAFCLICASLPCLAQDRPPAPVVDIADTVPTLPSPPPPPERPKVRVAAKPAVTARRQATLPTVCGPNGCAPAFCGPGGCPSPANCASGACATSCPNGSCGSGYYSRRGYFGGGRFFGRWRR